MWPNPQFSAHLVTFTEEILSGKLFLCSALPDNRGDAFEASLHGMIIRGFCLTSIRYIEYVTKKQDNNNSKNKQSSVEKKSNQKEIKKK